MKSSRSAFTLIELLVVIAIVGLLASIILAALSGARTGATLAASQQMASSLDNSLGSQAAVWYDFNECSNTTATDRSGYGRNGTLSSSSLWSATIPGRSGCSVGLNGSSQYVTLPQPLSSGSPFTIALWYYPTRVNASYDMLYSGTDNNDVQLFFQSGSHELRTSVENVEVPTSFVLSSSNINQWHFIVWVYDYSTDRVWVDGKQVLGTPQSTALSIGDATVTLGAVNGGSNPIAGNIDDFRIYATALTADAVLKLYAEGSKDFKGSLAFQPAD